MNAFIRIILFIICSVFLATFTLSGQEEDIRIELDKLIRYDTEISFSKTPGFIIGILDNDKTMFFPFGQRKLKTDDFLSKDDIFEIGSITKVFTASIVLKLADEGILQLDGKVNDYLDEEWQNPRLSQLSIYDLLYHQSGFPQRPAFIGKTEKEPGNPYAGYSKKDLLAYYRDYIPETPGFNYSHINYALLEIIIEHTTHKAYHDVLDALILRPEHLNHTFADFPEQKEDLIAPGYNRSKKQVKPWTYHSFKGSEGIKSSAADLLEYVKQYVFTDAIVSYPDTAVSFNERLSIWNGWQIIKMNGFNIMMHTGHTTGHYAFLAAIKETKTAVVILANSSIGTDDLGLQVLRMINYNWSRFKM